MDHNTPNNEIWDWQGTENFLEDSLDMPECLWNSVNQSDSFSLGDEFTPVKSCGDWADYLNICEDTIRGLEKAGERSSRVKRRRLHFNNEVSDTLLCNEEITPMHPRLEERKDSAVEDSYKMSEMVSGYSEYTSSSGYETSYQSSDACVAGYFNDAKMHYSSGDMASDVHIDVAELCKTQSAPEFASTNQDCHVRQRSNIFKGRKSYIQTPEKLTSSVVYPFAFIKPCGLHGDMTLKDINQRILAPPPKLKQKIDDNSYPTSAFSGKPVVGRTTLNIDGGKGSITIMRTKG